MDRNNSSFDGYPLISPKFMADSLEEANLPIPPEIWKANHFTNPLGSVGIGYILMVGQHLELIDFNVDTHQLWIETPPFNPVHAENLIIVPGKCRRVGKGSSDDPNAPYLVEIADRRWYGSNPYYSAQIRTPTDATNNIFNVNQDTFNMPTGIYPDQFYNDSRQKISAGSPLYIDWTWEMMAKCLWPPWLGSKPTTVLPFVPHGKPVGFDFRSSNHLEAFNYLLARLQCDLRFLPASGTFDVVQTGAADTLLAYTLLNLAGRKLDVNEYLGDRLIMPGGVTVHFHAESSQPGSEDTFSKDGNFTWRTSSVVKIESKRGVDVDQDDDVEFSPLMKNIYHVLWDDMVAKVDPFTGLVVNLADLEARADERAQQFFDGLDDTSAYRHEGYYGVFNLMPGSQLKAVSWREDEDGAWVTEIINHPAAMYRVNEDSGELEPYAPARNQGYAPIPEYVQSYETFVGRVEGSPDANGWQSVVERRLNPADNSIIDGTSWLAKDPNT